MVSKSCDGEAICLRRPEQPYQNCKNKLLFRGLLRLTLPPTEIPMSETTKPATPPIDQTQLKVSYANVCRIAQTPNEVIVDFGLNPNFFGPILDEPLKLDNRVIMSHDAAKRLWLHLTATLQNYESKYGTIELDVTKRLKPQATS